MRYCQLLCRAHQLRKPRGTHLFHNARAVDLDGPHACTAGWRRIVLSVLRESAASPGSGADHSVGVRYPT